MVPGPAGKLASLWTEATRRPAGALSAERKRSKGGKRRMMRRSSEEARRWHRYRPVASCLGTPQQVSHASSYAKLSRTRGQQQRNWQKTARLDNDGTCET
mmetsp:Transcript_150182/g.482672  ORF Transcript_150182/g.482672 Transcript_150182/m.482672 type:complete len:100 (+) Transcript_150182:219-518(+)